MIAEHELSSRFAASEWMYNVLLAMEPRPGMWIGAEDVWTLEVYLAGCLRGRRDCGRDDDDALLRAFGDWVRARAERRGEVALPAEPWSRVITRESPAQRNIRTFYARFREFLEESGQPPLHADSPPARRSAAMAGPMTRADGRWRDEIDLAEVARDAEDGAWMWEVLRSIERQPALLKGVENVRSLCAYLYGCARARHDCGHDDNARIMNVFTVWMQREAASRGEPVSLVMPFDIAVERVDSSPRNMWTFFRLFREFLAAYGLPPL